MVFVAPLTDSRNAQPNNNSIQSLHENHPKKHAGPIFQIWLNELRMMDDFSERGTQEKDVESHIGRSTS